MKWNNNNFEWDNYVIMRVFAFFEFLVGVTKYGESKKKGENRREEQQQAHLKSRE